MIDIASRLVQYLLMFLLILPAIVLHEVSHGYVAYLLGDPTAKRAGRLTLNPFPHIDKVGTIILPLTLIVLFGTAFGYAKPVPVNPRYFKNYRVGFFLTSIAGPTTNLTLAAVAGLAVRLIGGSGLAVQVLTLFATVNLVLMFFNLIPLPPLDGSRVIPLFLTDKGMQKYAQAEKYGFGILMLVLWGFPYLLHVDPLGWYLGATVDPLLRLLTGA